MQTAITLLLALGCATCAAAEPLVVRAILDVDHQHGCSQSVENRGLAGLVTLELPDDGTATLTVETHEITVLGPSFGRYRQGDTQFSDTRRKDRARWSGRAEETEGQWTLRFDRVEAAHVDQPQYGDLPYPDTSPTAASLLLHCSREAVAVFPAAKDDYSAWNTDGDSATPVEVLACRPDSELFDLASLATLDGTILMGPGYGITASGWHMTGGGADRTVFRVAAPRDLQGVFSTPPPPRLTCPEGMDHGCHPLARVPLDGGEVETVLTEGAWFGDVAVDETHVYWVASISFASLSAMEKATIADESRWDHTRELDWQGVRVHRMSRHGDDLFVAGETQLRAIPTDGAPATVLRDAQTFGVTADPDRVVWASCRSGDRSCDIVAMPRTGGTPTVVADSEFLPTALAVDSDGIYWANHAEGNFGQAGAIRALPTGENTPVTLVEDQRMPRVMTTDGDWIYWLCDTPDGRVVRRVHKAGGPAFELGRSYGHEGIRRNKERIAVDDRYVYWNGASAILRVPKHGGPVVALVSVDPAGADVVNFDIDDQYVWFTATVYDPAPPEPLDD